MARIQRQELKHDEFVDTFDATLLFLEEHSRALLLATLVVVLGSGSVGGYYWYSQRQEERAGVALTTALITFQAPVQAGLPPLPGEGVQRTFASEEERYKAAEKEFAAVRTDFPRTHSAQLARHYQAVCQFHLGQTEAALAALEDLSRSRDRIVAAGAKLARAGFCQKLGRGPEAAKLYRELAEKPTATVPRSLALMELATLEAEGNPEEARRLYNEIKNQFADTPVAAEATRRLELLPSPVVAKP